MKNIFIYFLILLVLASSGCKKDNIKILKEQAPVNELMGPMPSMYTSLNVNPGTFAEGASADFMTRWNKAVKAVEERGGRELKTFMIKFESPSELTVNITWAIPGGEQVIGVFTYGYTLNEQHELSFIYQDADANATTIAPLISELKEDYLEKYKFRLDWIEDKIPRSRNILAAYYRTDDPSSYFFGVVGVKENSTDVVDDSPLYLKVGVSPRPYSGILISSEPDKEQLSPDFRNRWNSAKAAMLQLSGRQLLSYSIDFISDTELTLTFNYKTSAGAEAKGISTYNYAVDAQGLLKITLISKNTNATAIAPALTSLVNDYLELYKFRIDWIDDQIAGSRNVVAAYYRADDPTSFFHGELIRNIALFLEMGFGTKYSSLTVTPEVPVPGKPLAPDFQERWDEAKTALLANGGRQLKSFVMRFISTTQVTFTYTYLTSANATATALFTYSYVIDAQGLMKLTYVSRNANGSVIAPSIVTLTDDYFAKHQFKIEWFNDEHTQAVYYRADMPTTYFFGAIGT